jgi:hypothetical protein
MDRRNSRVFPNHGLTRTATRTLFVILGHSRVEVILLLEQTTLQTVALVWSELAQETNSTAATELILMAGDESFQRNGDPESSLKSQTMTLFFLLLAKTVPKLSIFSKPRAKGPATIP